MIAPAFIVAAVLLLGGAPARADDATTASIARAREVETDIAASVARASPAFVVVAGGSGVLITPDGWVLTNHHVVSGRDIGDRWWVRRSGGERLRATLVGADPRGDIALLKLESDRPLPHLPLADSDLVRIGDLAIALGNPYGFGTRDAVPTVSLGIVSAVHAYRNNYNDAIQTDAAINPGNSGGPLLNLRGEVIGINGRVAVRFGNRMNTGVGYAIPANQIKRFLPRLQKGGIVRHGQIPGLDLTDTDEGGGGALVDAVRPSSPAARAGFLPGDIIVRVDTRDVRSPSAFSSAIGCYPAGDEIMVIVRRRDTEVPLRATLAAFGAGPDRAFLGVRLEDAPSGVRVAAVVPNSPAARAGIEAGDLLLRFAGTPLREADDIEGLLASRKPGATVSLELKRGETSLGLEVELAKAP